MDFFHKANHNFFILHIFFKFLRSYTTKMVHFKKKYTIGESSKKGIYFQH